MTFKRIQFFSFLLSGTLLLAVPAFSALVYPENDPDLTMHIQRKYFELKTDDQPRSEMTEQRALELINDFFTFFGSEKGAANLRIELDWKNPYLSAHAQMKDNSSVVTVWGGFLRAPGMTPTILATTLCHELGHVIGGAPYQTIQGAEFSTEGQSDFFAGLYCLPRFARAFPKYFLNSTPAVQEACQGNRSCEVTLDSGLATVQFMQKWSFAPYEPVSLKAAAPEVQDYRPNHYPSFQCRLDIFSRAAVCLKDQVEKCPPPSCWWPQDLDYPPMAGY